MFQSLKIYTTWRGLEAMGKDELYDKFYRENRDKSETELQTTILLNGKTITTLSANPTIQEQSLAAALLAEMKACQKILDLRKSKKEHICRIIDKWRSKESDRREKAVFNLPAATSANGQLIASILEESDGQTAEEIAGWYEELAAIDTIDFQSLLNQLVEETILTCKNNKYYLSNICTGTLYPDDTVKWAMKKIHSNLSYEEKAMYTVILEALEMDDYIHNFTESDDDTIFYIGCSNNWTDENYQFYYSNYKRYLSKLRNAEIIQLVPGTGTASTFAIPMLNSKEDTKTFAISLLNSLEDTKS